MPRKRHNVQSLKPFTVNSPAQAPKPDRPPASVNERLANLRREASVATGSSSSIQPAAPSLPPAIREVLQLPEVPAPLPRRRPARRFDNEGRRLPAGPAPPRSWLSRGADVNSSPRPPPPAVARSALALPDVYWPAPDSLVDLTLRRLARDWEVHRAYSQHILFYLPDHLKPALMRCLGVAGPGITVTDLKAILLPPSDERGDGLPWDRQISCLDLSGSIGRCLSLNALSRLLFPRIRETEGAESVQDSWDAAESIPSPPRSLLPNLTHLSLALDSKAGQGDISWRQLLALASKISSTLTHLSLAFWPTPRLSAARIDATTDGDDWAETLLVLKSLSRKLYRLEYVDLTGCAPWFRALKLESGHDSVDWVSSWGRISLLRLYSGWPLDSSSDRVARREVADLAKSIERHIVSKRAGKSMFITVERDEDQAVMTSHSAATILCTAKQTRFHIASPNYRELDIEGLSITVSSADASTKGKGKTRAQGIEILAGAQLKLKQGRRYGLVGRNGTGKSIAALLKAIAEKLIPGIPEDTRIAILQQTRLADGDDAVDVDGQQTSVLRDVVNKATTRDVIEQEIKVLSSGVDSSDPYGPVRALRALKHERLRKRLFLLDKEARLRSGARGSQARKALVAFEKVVAESEAMLQQPSEDMAADLVQAETLETTDLLAQLQLQVEPSRVERTESRARALLAGLGFSEDRMYKPIASMSGGWHMRASLATALLQEADFLILDEPTNFLDMLGIVWLQRHLDSLETADKPPTMMLVSHDRDFIGRLCTDLIILKDKQLTYFHGDLAALEASQAERKLWLGRMREAQDKQRAHMEKTIQQNLKAGRANDDQNKMRQAKSRQKKLDDRSGMQVNARGGRFKLNRDLAGFHLTSRDELEAPAEERPVVIALPAPPDLRFPGSLLSLDRASFRYSARAAAVVRDVSLTVGMGDRVGIVGLNGAGKSTLVRLLVDGESGPTSGAVATHPRLRRAYYSQHAVDELRALGRSEPALTALSLLTREVDGQLDEGQVRGLLGELGLPGRVASDIPLAKLSGGQLVRCELARLLWRRPHCLVLDEVTTHLDYETVTALRVALAHWDGAVVLVSHDRWFMRGVVEGRGLGDDGGGGDDDDDDDEGDGEGSRSEDEASPRRRVTYRLKAGSLSVLDGGVDEFEALMEKRADKLLRQEAKRPSKQM
ncbi:hypothetical protein L249_3789 [Ophiocordyceps polyrhachis-furcata BCC 54312]|uniref:ABC transporter domain-containing protein n=1 Tax=Ophiocordyceps polyrhachis-furcata BCC 54312 TaxID=1330021 RepID=A0A367L5I4_9HYPO|nr:hypothetical protein L249_3789 [Ophiocordyceps polyrhachis-furcata BCC 54312]